MRPMYLSLCLPLPGSAMCIQTEGLEGDMTKNSQKPLSCSFFRLLLPVLRHQGKLNPNKEEMRCVLLLESVGGSWRSNMSSLLSRW